MSQMHVVARRFHGAGAQREIGEIVETSEWRHAAQLERSRYLGAVPAGVDVITCKCGRHWAGQEAVERHGCEAKQPGAGNQQNRNQQQNNNRNQQQTARR